MYKLVVADLDGTLVHNKEISNKTKQTIRDLQNEGIHFSIATGRHIDAAMSIYDELQCKGPIICSNGAVIIDPLQKKVIAKTVMEDDSAVLIMEVCRKLHADFIVYTTEEIIATEKGKQKLLDKIAKKTEIKITVMSIDDLISHVNENVLKILIIEYDETLNNRVANLVRKVDDVSVVMSQYGFIDCGHTISNKGIAIEKLAHYYGIAVEEVCAFGDQENDIPMIESAGLGISMGNGVPNLKYVADFITSDVRDDGFTFGVEMFVLTGDMND